MRLLGIGLDIPVVAYDNRDVKWAGRVAFLLDAFGHSNVSILDEKADFTLESGPVPPCNGKDFNFILKEDLVTSFEQIKLISNKEIKA